MSRWTRIQELFEEVVDLDETQRLGRLRQASIGDPELESEVWKLLDADSSPHRGFDRSPTEILATLGAEPAPEELCGELVDSYRVEAHLSSGGMGHVYRALREVDGVQQRVAIKVLRPGLGTQAFLERFQRERATLALLEHEHIVSFLDAGCLSDGRPYLVMELVEGVVLTEWARDRSRLEKIQLMLRVLAAIQYAHQKLIVHRDLKPSNVLITPEGSPRVLDFGVATALEERGGRSTATPAALTPAFASPEDLRGDPSTTASDIYSLGRLFDALIGPEQLDADLQSIVSRSCEPNPESRYASADCLAEDLRRYLRGEAVHAREGGLAYRASRTARRYRWPLALAAGVLVALITGWIASDMQRRAAEANAGLGWRAHAQARLTARVFEGWIATSINGDPDLAIDAVSYLESALEEELREWPEAETLVRLTLADIYLAREEPWLAAPHAIRASELGKTTRGLSPQDRQRAEALVRLTR